LRVLPQWPVTGVLLTQRRVCRMGSPERVMESTAIKPASHNEQIGDRDGRVSSHSREQYCRSPGHTRRAERLRQASRSTAIALLSLSRRTEAAPRRPDFGVDHHGARGRIDGASRYGRDEWSGEHLLSASEAWIGRSRERVRTADCHTQTEDVTASR